MNLATINAPDHTCYRARAATNSTFIIPCDPNESQCPRCIWERLTAKVGELTTLLRDACAIHARSRNLLRFQERVIREVLEEPDSGG